MKKVPAAAAEFDGASLGDRRLDRRLSMIASRLSVSPAASFPQLVPTLAEREAFYRFVENERVDWQSILAPHYAATAGRCQAARIVRIAHDTTWFGFEGVRMGLGPLGSNVRAKGPRGFAGHFSLAVSKGPATAVLGMAAVSAFVREDNPVARTKEQRKAKHLASRLKPSSEKESARWMNSVRLAEERVGRDVDCIHVMDQEADNFAILADLLNEGRRFVIRGSAERVLVPRKRRVSIDDALDETIATVFRPVPLSARPKPYGRHKVRAERTAELMIRARPVTLSKPEHAQHATKKLALHVVQVFEPTPPNGEDPVEWTLYTTEPIATADDLATVVDHYRARWTVEEFFKALKTGCSYERRQLESYDALLRALALLVPFAWHLLAIRDTARDAGTLPASHLVDDVQLDVLRALTPSSRLPRRATTNDVMRAIADLGGHISQNGQPGWLVLGRGYEEFAKAEAVWRAALAHAAK